MELEFEIFTLDLKTEIKKEEVRKRKRMEYIMGFDEEDEDDREVPVPRKLEEEEVKPLRTRGGGGGGLSSSSRRVKETPGFDTDLRALDDLLRELRVLRRNDIPPADEGTGTKSDSENSRKCRALVREQYSNSVRGKAQVPPSSSSAQFAKQTRQACLEMLEEVEKSEGLSSDYGYKERRGLEVKLSLAASQLENTKFKYQ